MKDEGSLDSAGPFAIFGFLVVVLVVATWIMVAYQGDWGSTEAPAVASVEATDPVEAH